MVWLWSILIWQVTQTFNAWFYINVAHAYNVNGKFTALKTRNQNNITNFFLTLSVGILFLEIWCDSLINAAQFRTIASSTVTIWAASWKKQQTDCAPSEDSVQPGHQPSLIRVFAVRMKNAWVLTTHWAHSEDSDSLGAQWFCWFCHEAAHIVFFEA